jgi:hypothetical protein
VGFDFFEYRVPGVTQIEDDLTKRLPLGDPDVLGTFLLSLYFFCTTEFAMRATAIPP